MYISRTDGKTEGEAYSQGHTQRWKKPIEIDVQRGDEVCGHKEKNRTLF